MLYRPLPQPDPVLAEILAVIDDRAGPAVVHLSRKIVRERGYPAALRVLERAAKAIAQERVEAINPIIPSRTRAAYQAEYYRKRKAADPDWNRNRKRKQKGLKT